MKKMILSLAAVMMMGFSVFANGNDNVVTQEARDAFKKDFATASNIKWEQVDNKFLKATFSFNGQVLAAYYNSNGDLQAVVRNITSDQLPINLVTGLRRDYTAFWITDLFEISSDGQTTYYVTVENSDKKIVLKSDDLASWQVYSKERKAAVE
ncbi:MAG TPA: hypothetical protein VFE32_07215 [Puia sp.]|jgi:hypothetical protein|nr:hypothetical protein [Puia sp.]